MDWKRIKAEYVAGGTSYRKLAEKYKVSLTTLQRIAKKENWIGLRQRAEDKSDTKIVESVSRKNAEIDDKYYRIVDKLFAKAEEVIDTTPVWQPTTIKEMATAIKYLKECKGLKSDADMREQEARIAKLQREAEEDTTDAQKDIVVRIEGGVNDAWQK